MADIKLRMFVAIELPEYVKQHIAATIAQLKRQANTPGARWVAAESLHVTLKFLGDVPASRIETIQSSLESVCAAASPMRLSISTLGAFPSIRAPRIVWAGIGGDTNALCVLAHGFDQALSTLGFAPETRDFTPHLTLARIRPDTTVDSRVAIGGAIARVSSPHQLTFSADAAAIMRSHLMPTGAKYSRITALPFGSRAS